VNLDNSYPHHLAPRRREKEKPVTDLFQQPQSETVTSHRAIWSVAIAGGVFSAAPFVLTRWASPDYGKWEVIAATTLTNIGTTLFLAAALFLLEPRFTKSVTSAVTETAKREVAAQTEDIRQTTQALQQQVGDITKELAQRRQERADERTAAVEDVREGVSFDSVAALLERANSMRALRYGSVVLPTGADFDSPRVQVYWGERTGGRFGVGNIFADAEQGIALSYEVPFAEQDGGYSPALSVWLPSQRPAEALDNLVTAMQTAGYVVASEGISAQLFDHLANALEQAMAARADPARTWLRGRLDEWIADGWAITDRGLESRDGIRIDAADFPDARFAAAPGGRKLPAKFEPEAPDDVDPELWKLAVERSRYKFKGSQATSVAAADRAPVAYTIESTPRLQDGWPRAR
jgi:hypothetical protein